MAVRKSERDKRSKSASGRGVARRAGPARGRRRRGGGRDQLFDPSEIFRFDESGDGLEHILCSDGFAGEFAEAINEQCCGVWGRLAQLPGAKLGRGMVVVLDSTGNGKCLSAEEKQLIRDWPPYQLRYAVDSVVNACKEYGTIDPHLTKLKTPPNLPPAVWVWTRAYGANDPWPSACGVYLVFMHPDFELEFPGDCGSHPTVAGRGAPVLGGPARRRERRPRNDEAR